MMTFRFRYVLPLMAFAAGGRPFALRMLRTALRLMCSNRAMCVLGIHGLSCKRRTTADTLAMLALNFFSSAPCRVQTNLYSFRISASCGSNRTVRTPCFDLVCPRLRCLSIPNRMWTLSLSNSISGHCNASASPDLTPVYIRVATSGCQILEYLAASSALEDRCFA